MGIYSGLRGGKGGGPGSGSPAIRYSGGKGGGGKSGGGPAAVYKGKGGGTPTPGVKPSATPTLGKKPSGTPTPGVKPSATPTLPSIQRQLGSPGQVYSPLNNINLFNAIANILSKPGGTSMYQPSSNVNLGIAPYNPLSSAYTSVDYRTKALQALGLMPGGTQAKSNVASKTTNTSITPAPGVNKNYNYDPTTGKIYTTTYDPTTGKVFTNIVGTTNNNLLVQSDRDIAARRLAEALPEWKLNQLGNITTGTNEWLTEVDNMKTREIALEKAKEELKKQLASTTDPQVINDLKEQLRKISNSQLSNQLALVKLGTTYLPALGEGGFRTWGRISQMYGDYLGLQKMRGMSEGKMHKRQTRGSWYSGGNNSGGGNDYGGGAGGVSGGWANLVDLINWRV